MGAVVSLDEFRPHMTGTAVCMNCRHEWQAVAPQGTPVLECPECRCFKGVWKNYVFADVGQSAWQCGKCQNEFFVMMPDRIMCANCGEPQHGMWD
jgi:DNA-directed RNA polymerase subunit RPC12/RpoP